MKTIVNLLDVLDLKILRMILLDFLLQSFKKKHRCFICINIILKNYLFGYNILKYLVQEVLNIIISLR